MDIEAANPGPKVAKSARAGLPKLLTSMAWTLLTTQARGLGITTIAGTQTTIRPSGAIPPTLPSDGNFVIRFQLREHQQQRRLLYRHLLQSARDITTALQESIAVPHWNVFRVAFLLRVVTRLISNAALPRHSRTSVQTMPSAQVEVEAEVVLYQILASQGVRSVVESWVVTPPLRESFHGSCLSKRAVDFTIVEVL